jgi:hypothetical protein
MRALSSLQAVAAVVVLAATACARRGPVHVESVRVAQGALAGPLREAGVDEATLEAAAREALAGAGFRLEPGGARTYRARVDVLSVRLAPRAGGARVEVALAIELAPVKADAEILAETGVAEAPLAGGTPATAWRTAVKGAARQAAEGLALGLAEDRKSDAQLVADLASKDGRVREHAVRALAERRSPEAVPALIERLDDDDPDVVQRAVGALALVKDPRAVKPLIDLSRRGDTAQTARLARIIGDIGGPEAEGYLLTLEAAHPDPRVRRAARDALADMAARAEPAAAAASR